MLITLTIARKDKTRFILFPTPPILDLTGEPATRFIPGMPRVASTRYEE